MAEMITEDDDKKRGEVAKWVKEIQLYEKEFQSWEDKAKKIIRRYKDERKNASESVKGKYNILWSNVQTLLPSVFAQNPNPNVERRNLDEDQVASRASEVIERGLAYYVKEDDFFDVMESVALDRLLGGRATAGCRYIPEFEEGIAITNEVGESVQSPDSDLKSEKISIDYVNWQDFGHTWGRTWDEVCASWKKAYLTAEQGEKRFGEIFKKVPLDYVPKKTNSENVDDGAKKACVYEIWDKENKKVIWISKSYPMPLDEKEDPLHLKNFFPWPKPFYATLANDNLIPTPDFSEYQDQAIELDELTARIRMITKAIKAAGVYDSSAPGLERLMVEGNENVLLPVSNWAVFGEKGGLKGAISMLPMQEIAATLLVLYEARDKVKQDLNEISGLSDIVRGQGDPNETATAQGIKGNFATMRLDRVQKQMQRFCRDTIRIMGELMAEHFSLKTLQEISGLKLPTQAEKQQFQAQQQQGQQPQPPPPIDEKTLEFMNEPTWEEVYAFLKNDRLRSFRIDIETDSTIKMDQDAERQARMEFLTAAGGFMQQMQTVQNPDLQPLLAEMLMFGVRSFKVGKDLENSFRTVLEKLEKEAQAPKPPVQDPEMIKQEAESQRQQMEIQSKGQMEQMKIQSQGQIAQLTEQATSQREEMKAGFLARIESMKQDHEKQMKGLEIAFDADKCRLDNETKIMVAKIQASTSLRTARMSAAASAEGGASGSGDPDGDDSVEAFNLQPENTLNDFIAMIGQNLERVFSSNAEINGNMSKLVDAMNTPKKVIRSLDGKMTHVVPDLGVMQ